MQVDGVQVIFMKCKKEKQPKHTTTSQWYAFVCVCALTSLVVRCVCVCVDGAFICCVSGELSNINTAGFLPRTPACLSFCRRVETLISRRPH